MKKLVYDFAEGSAKLKALLGGKGANIAEMKRIGLPVPDGFTITTEACNDYFANDNQLSKSLLADIDSYLEKLEQNTDKKFGDANNPLLVSVRSGAAISMPGMMDTVLNLGLNEKVTKGLAKLTENERFAYDSYRRFIQMYGDVVLGIKKYEFDMILNAAKKSAGIASDAKLTAEQLKEIIKDYKALVLKLTGKAFPEEPKEQLIGAVRAVFDSWNNQRAKVYRKLNNIDDKIGTAVNIQSMVFGNMGEDSGTGVAFTRNPATGENVLFGEFLLNAQGEDVVAGIRTPVDIKELKNLIPAAYEQFVALSEQLEKHYRDLQDIEFTIEKGKLFLLQTRTAKRTAKAALAVAVQLVEEGIIDKKEAIMRIEPEQIEQLLHPSFSSEELAKAEQLTKGLPASPGAAAGKIYFDADAVLKAKKDGEKAILVRAETSPEDIEGMISAVGILTASGGMTSHAAVVARGMGKCCVSGCSEIKVFENQGYFMLGERKFETGDVISLDGNTGIVYAGEVKTVSSAFTDDFVKIMTWADEFRRLKIRANADNKVDALKALEFGAEGIGLCRTEHMFFDKERIKSVREMIVAKDLEAREKALAKLLPYQKQDFIDIFTAMTGKPVTVRLLDPPLHEFLPTEKEEIKELANELGMEFEKLNAQINRLKEVNPMLGHRGCRLAITYPEIYQMQVKAIATAVVECIKNGISVEPEIMIPLVGSEKELAILVEQTHAVVKAVQAESKQEFNYKVGTMIEVPRAALTADKIAEKAEFFSFGTNDLTQMTLGFSRDDAAKFIGEYVDKEVYARDPFESIDQEGVGALVEMAVTKAKVVRPEIKLGVCGEHGGDPASIAFFEKIGLAYVSCSPYRLPVARLAAARAVLGS